MNLKKKIIGILMSVSLMIAMIPSVAYAASGKISFTDLTTEAGVEFDIRVVASSESDDIEYISVNLNYDSDLIQFVSGDGVTSDGSTLTFETETSGTSAETTITFLALKEGSASITIASQTVTGTDGSVFEMTEGNSAIEISGGTEVEVTDETVESTDEAGTGITTSTSTEVTVADVTYTISNDFLETEIPEGYVVSTYEYGGETYSGAVDSVSGIVIGCLVDTSGAGQFFYYDSATASFQPYVQIDISESAYIIFLTTDIEETISSDFVETVLTVNGFEFPTWEDTSSSGMYLIHAINSNGEDSIYSYDTQDQTYQRYYVETELSTTEEIIEVTNAVSDYMQLIAIAIAALAFILLIIVIVLAVKLRNRNLELDDVYDEIDFMKESTKTSANKKQSPKEGGVKKPEKKHGAGDAIYGMKKEEKFEDEFDKFDDFDDDFDDFTDEFDDFDDFSDKEAEAYERDVKDEYSQDFDDFDDFELDFDELEELPKKQVPKQAPKQELKQAPKQAPKQELKQAPKQELKKVPKKTIKNASARRKAGSGSGDNDDIDFIDL